PATPDDIPDRGSRAFVLAGRREAVAVPAVRFSPGRAAGDRDRPTPARPPTRWTAPDACRHGAARTRGPRRVAPAVGRYADHRLESGAPRASAARLLPDGVGRIRSVRDRPASARPQRASSSPQRGDSQHPRTPFLSGEFDLAVGYQDITIERRELHGAQRIDL